MAGTSIGPTVTRALGGSPTIRPYRSSDRAAVLERLSPIIGSLYPEGDRWLRRRLAEVERGHARADIAVGRSGFAGIAIDTPKTATRAKLSTLWVAEEARRQGTGRALIDARREDWLRKGIHESAITARIDVAEPLASLLLPRGFEVVQVEADRYGPGKDEVVFCWHSRTDPGERRDAPRAVEGLVVPV